MAEIVNLNRFRKDVKRREKTAEAAENRVKFGRTRAERERLAAERKLADRRIDGHEIVDT